MKDMALDQQKDDVEMEESGQAEEATREKTISKDDDDYPTDLTWAQLMAQLLHDRSVAQSLSGQGVVAFHLQRLDILSLFK